MIFGGITRASDHRGSLPKWELYINCLFLFVERAGLGSNSWIVDKGPGFQTLYSLFVIGVVVLSCCDSIAYTIRCLYPLLDKCGSKVIAEGHLAYAIVEFLTNGASPPQHIQKPRACATFRRCRLLTLWRATNFAAEQTIDCGSSLRNWRRLWLKTAF